MIIREGPTEEERRRMRRIRLLDYCCLGIAALIVVLTVLELIYSMGGIRVLEAVMLLGTVLNLGLAVRAAAVEVRIAAAGALALAAACLGGFIYLVLLR